MLGQHLKRKQGKCLHVVLGAFYLFIFIYFKISELSSVFSIFILSALAASET